MTPPEQCEDGNSANGDGCTSSCTLEFCGDGIINNNGTEACDPPGTALCTNSCTIRDLAFCGDGEMDGGEECDDGNTDDGDGCSASCELEPAPMPDAGTPDGGVADAGLPDGSMPDGGDLVPSGSSGGGCSVQSGRAPIDLSVLLGMLALVVLRRRRRGRY
jgi:cysteine-rich repeat protein